MEVEHAMEDEAAVEDRGRGRGRGKYLDARCHIWWYLMYLTLSDR